MGHDHARRRRLPRRGDFNPRARVGHDPPKCSCNHSRTISIHVPAWGTTTEIAYSFRSEPISIHVPAWGTTRRGRPARRHLTISIHVPAWGTTARYRAGVRRVPISIHVPAWGTTIHQEVKRDERLFQSTCPRGARPIGARRSSAGWDFNPRARVGHDSGVAGVRGPLPDFNPRARVGHDLGAVGAYYGWLFQSTCPRGARLAAVWEFSAQVVFQSTCPRGARQQYSDPIRDLIDFNPRARVGHDVRTVIPWRFAEFQSTCPRGARHSAGSSTTQPEQFQSTCPRGARLTWWIPESEPTDFNPRARVGHDSETGLSGD